MVSCEVAGKLLGLSRATMFEYSRDVTIPSVRVGKRGVIRFEVSALRSYAKEKNLYFDEELARAIESPSNSRD